eukprot:m.275414 g.275414  ORF g.275414 m.275414 type:complete len:667 (+) comp54851_c0_seq11:104-2104(+)
MRSVLSDQRPPQPPPPQLPLPQPPTRARRSIEAAPSKPTVRRASNLDEQLDSILGQDQPARVPEIPSDATTAQARRAALEDRTNSGENESQDYCALAHQFGRPKRRRVDTDKHTPLADIVQLLSARPRTRSSSQLELCEQQLAAAASESLDAQSNSVEASSLAGHPRPSAASFTSVSSAPPTKPPRHVKRDRDAPSDSASKSDTASQAHSISPTPVVGSVDSSLESELGPRSVSMIVGGKPTKGTPSGKTSLMKQLVSSVKKSAQKLTQKLETSSKDSVSLAEQRSLAAIQQTTREAMKNLMESASQLEASSELSNTRITESTLLTAAELGASASFTTSVPVHQKAISSDPARQKQYYQQQVAAATRAPVTISSLYQLAVGRLGELACTEVLSNGAVPPAHGNSSRQFQLSQLVVALDWAHVSKLKEQAFYCFGCVLQLGAQVLLSNVILLKGSDSIDRLEFLNDFTFFNASQDFTLQITLLGLRFAHEEIATGDPLSLRPAKRQFIEVAHGTLRVSDLRKQTIELTCREDGLFPKAQSISWRSAIADVEGGELAGFLTLQGVLVDSQLSWNRKWAIMSSQSIRYWRQPEDTNKDPEGVIEIRSICNPSVAKATSTQCSRLFSFVLDLQAGERRTTLKLSADSKDQMDSWLDKCNEVLARHRAWFS